MKKVIVFAGIILFLASCKKTDDPPEGRETPTPCTPYANMVLEKTKLLAPSNGDTILWKEWQNKQLQLRWTSVCGAEKYVVYRGEIRDDGYGRHADYPLDTVTTLDYYHLISQMINDNLFYVDYDWAVIALRSGSTPVSSDTSHFILKIK